MLNKLINRNFITLYSFVRKTNDHEDEALTVCTFIAFWYSMIGIYFTVIFYYFANIESSKPNTMGPFIFYFLIVSIYVYRYIYSSRLFEELIQEHEKLSESKKFTNKFISIVFTLFLVVFAIPLALYL